MALYNVTEYTVPSQKCSINFYETLDALADIAVNNGLIQNTLSEKNVFTSTIMNVFLPSPHRIEDDFWKAYEHSPVSATSYFYHLSQNSNYIKMNRIAKNVAFKTFSLYGSLDITINLSKPENDPNRGCS